MLINQKTLEELFARNSSQPNFVDLGIRSDNFVKGPISKREISTLKSFRHNSVSDIANAEGSPSYETINHLVKVLKKLSILPDLNGFGVELGSGIGLLSAAIIDEDNQSKIRGILAVEAVLPFVEFGIKYAAREILGHDQFKIIPCHGSFNSMNIADSTIDFIVQIESLHHADHLLPPIAESFRILKKGGFFISIDRSWPNDTKRAVLEELLDHKYSKDWLIQKGFPKGVFSRRDNGEHEYIDIDWNTTFEKCGYTRKKIFHLHPELTFRHILKRVICLFKLNRIFGIKIKSRNGLIRSFLIYKLKLLSTKFSSVIISPHPRPLTISIWEKPNY
jgi:SAM-dependent methyltransferase